MSCPVRRRVHVESKLWLLAAVSGQAGDLRKVAGVSAPRRTAVAASSTWVDPEGVRRPAGEVHGWQPGMNQTLCGLALSKSRLGRFPHVSWADAQPDTGGHADAVSTVCRRCAAAMGTRRDSRPWNRSNPRP
jgi:hypothetical protein